MLYKNAGKINDRLALFKTWLICATLVCIIFSLLISCSICIILLTATWFFEGDLLKKWNMLRKDVLFSAYSLYFLTQLLGILYAQDIIIGWKNVESKLGFLILPIIFCSSDFVTENIGRKIMLVTTITLTLASLYCFGIAIIEFGHTHDRSVFFYHRLVNPIDQHAVYFSVYTFISILFLWWDGEQLKWLNKWPWLRICWIGYFVLLTYFLASKLVIATLVIYFAYVFMRILAENFKKWQVIVILGVGILVISSLFTFNNPVRQRFSDLLSFNRETLVKQKYTPGDYFNGIEFRLLLWPVSFELIRENHALLFGVGPSNTQSIVAKKFLDMGLYAGNNTGTDHGYLDYNCHNQFLQVSLQSGIIGLLAFVFWSYTIIRKTFQKKNQILSGIIIMIFVFFLTESVFEREFGMILCTVFPLLYLYPKNR
jgi:O-antigen ligase